MPDGPRTQLAELKIPAQSEYIGLAKRVATSLGSQLGFGLEKIDELSIAVVQACGSTIEAADEMWGPGATLKLSFGSTERAFMVDVEALAPRSHEALPTRRQVPANRSAELEMQRALARDMIRLFVDDFRHQVDTGRRQIHYRMVKYLIS
jgi:anti-sigma regulatory factor (Ser/Thr protein kinase)